MTKKLQRTMIPAVLALALPLGAAAQSGPALSQPSSQALRPAGTQSGATATPEIRGFEAYTSHHNITSGFDDWNEVGVRGTYQRGRHLFQGELAAMERWSEKGVYAAFGDTYTFNDDWYGSLTIGAGDGAEYLPRYRIDGFINRKLLAAKNLVGTLGAGYYRAPDGHIDRNVSIGGTYYFDFPLVVQGEVRFTHGSPGSVDTRQQFLAATYGREKATQVTGRYAWGSEGYQSIGPGAVLTNFRSKEASVNVRHWLGPTWGIDAALEHYRNPFYRRNGFVAGLFWQIP